MLPRFLFRQIVIWTPRQWMRRFTAVLFRPHRSQRRARGIRMEAETAQWVPSNEICYIYIYKSEFKMPEHCRTQDEVLPITSYAHLIALSDVVAPFHLFIYVIFV